THVEIDAKYDVYLQRQRADVEAFRRDEALLLDGIDYGSVPGLSNEVRQRLDLQQPRTLGQAARLVGMTPAALGILVAYQPRAVQRGALAAGPAAAAEAGAGGAARRGDAGRARHPGGLSAAGGVAGGCVLGGAMTKTAAMTVSAADKARALRLVPVSHETEAR